MANPAPALTVPCTSILSAARLTNPPEVERFGTLIAVPTAAVSSVTPPPEVVSVLARLAKVMFPAPVARKVTACEPSVCSASVPPRSLKLMDDCAVMSMLVVALTPASAPVETVPGLTPPSPGAIVPSVALRKPSRLPEPAAPGMTVMMLASSRRRSSGSAIAARTHEARDAPMAWRDRRAARRRRRMEPSVPKRQVFQANTLRCAAGSRTTFPRPAMPKRMRRGTSNDKQKIVNATLGPRTSDVEVLYFQRVVLDELPAAFDVFAHEHTEHALGLGRLL
jgi:hypothetical protein